MRIIRYLINPHSISPRFTLVRPISQELWSLVTSTLLKSKFTMTSRLLASRETLTHLEVVRFWKRHSLILNEGSIQCDPESRRGQLRTMSFKFVEVYDLI